MNIRQKFVDFYRSSSTPIEQFSTSAAIWLRHGIGQPSRTYNEKAASVMIVDIVYINIYAYIVYRYIPYDICIDISLFIPIAFM